MPIDKTKCCKTHTEEKEESGECCQLEQQEDAFALTFENETTANFKKCLKDSGFKQIVDNFKRKKEDFFNTRELLIDYANDNLL